MYSLMFLFFSKRLYYLFPFLSSIIISSPFPSIINIIMNTPPSPTNEMKKRKMKNGKKYTRKKNACQHLSFFENGATIKLTEIISTSPSIDEMSIRFTQAFWFPLFFEITSQMSLFKKQKCFINQISFL